MIDMLPLLDWTSFVYFALPTVVLLARLRHARHNVEAILGNSCGSSRRIGACRLYRWYVALARTPTDAYNGGDTAMVLTVCYNSRANRLHSLALRMDTLVFGYTVYGFYGDKCLQTRDTQQNYDARPGESVFRTSRHIVHICLFALGSSSIGRHIHHIQKEKDTRLRPVGTTIYVG